MHKQYRSRGFTIVELTITIIVIAILATIATFAYGNARQRAEASAVSSHVHQYATLMEMYIARNHRAPAANWRCLGDTTTLPATNGYEAGFCFKPASNHDGSDTGNTAPADPALMTELKGILGEIPPAGFPESFGSSGRPFRGIVYDGSTNNFPNNPAVIVYYTNLTTCPIGEKVAWWTVSTPQTSGCAYRLSVNEFGVPR